MPSLYYLATRPDLCFKGIGGRVLIDEQGRFNVLCRGGEFDTDRYL